MNSIDIYRVLKNNKYSKKSFFGVVARDQLPQRVKWPSSFVMNTDKSSKPGQHWLAFFLYKKWEM